MATWARKQFHSAYQCHFHGALRAVLSLGAAGKERHDQLVMSALGRRKGREGSHIHTLDAPVAGTSLTILRILAAIQ